MKKIKKYIAILLAAVVAVSCFFALTACDKNKDDEGKRYIEKDTFYSIDTLASSIKGLPTFIFDTDVSGVTLRTDGTSTFKLAVKDGLATTIQNLLGDVELGDVDMSIVLNMIYEYFPGLNLADLKTVLDIFEGSLNLKLMGLDPADEEIQAMFTEMAQTGHLTSITKIPEGLGLEINADYYIKDITSEYTGKTYTGVYMGHPHPDGESFWMMELTTDTETGKPKIVIDYPLIDIYIYCYAE